MKYSLVSVFATAFFTGVQAASNVIDLTPANFDSVVGQGKPALVEFFAPWCGHCKNLAPTYEQLADSFAHAKEKVVIAKVDADGEGKPLGQKYGVSGYPTLKWFSANGDVEPYEGGRDLDALSAFVAGKSGARSKVKPPPEPSYKILDHATFDSVALDPTKDVLVSFTAPWCGHCKTMKPEYEKLAVDFASESDCIVANIDADAAENAELKVKYGVTGFPTIKFFSKDNKEEPETYNFGRTEPDFVKYLNEKCGTHRIVGGGLSDKAGRLSEFDLLASKFVSASADARAAIYDEAATLAATAGDAAQRYLKIMKKVVNGTEDYIEMEKRRLAKMMDKRSVFTTSKLDDIKVRANVIAAFVEEKAEEAKEKVEHFKEEL